MLAFTLDCLYSSSPLKLTDIAYVFSLGSEMDILTSPFASVVCVYVLPFTVNLMIFPANGVPKPSFSAAVNDAPEFG